MLCCSFVTDRIATWDAASGAGFSLQSEEDVSISRKFESCQLSFAGVLFLFTFLDH